jgi:sulfur carrier protein ThiS
LARLAFTSHLRAVGPTGSVRYEGATLSEALKAAGADYPQLLPYILDDQGRVRKHIAVFVDGAMVPREAALSMPLSPESEVYVLQALSGG